MDTCNYDGCDRPVHARGACSTHYRDARAAAIEAGDIQTRATPGSTMAERIDAHVTTSGDCEVWDGYTHRGAPSLTVRRPDGTRHSVNVRAEQLALAGHQRPPGQWFPRVRCGNHLCVNPEHLEWSNRRSDARLSPSQVNRLIELHRNGLLNVSDAADELGVSRQAIYVAMERSGYTAGDRDEVPGEAVIVG